MKNVVTIKTFINTVDLNLVKSFLESEGIECFTQNELLNQTFQHIGNTIDARLQVSENDAPEAIRLLIEGGFAKKEDYDIPKEIQQADKVIDWLKNIFKGK